MKTLFDATGDVQIITGGSSGLGAHLARSYAAAGGTSVIFDVNEPDFAGDRIECHKVDVSDRDNVFAAATEVIAAYGHIDALTAGAAIQPRTRLSDISPEEWQRVQSVNLNGVLWACQAVLPHMRRQQSGSIVAFTSGTVHLPQPTQAAYATTKAAIQTLVRILAAEEKGNRIRVNAVAPGVIETAQFLAGNPKGSPEYERWKQSPGIGQTEDVVDFLMFLHSANCAITGSVLPRETVYNRTGTSR